VDSKKDKLKFLLANLPWYKDGRCGVRAGSRWPHIRDEREDSYLPFPFFLAYASSLLKKHDFDAYLIDAIAEKATEQEFLNRAARLHIDYLVAETSVPSFCDDIRLLEKLSSSGISIILCGPTSESYEPEFLEAHPFISFVLYGEYEFTLLELASALIEGRGLSHIKGLIYRDQARVRKNPKRGPFDINTLPWPQREGLPMHRYLDAPGGMPLPSVQMVASRGCPFGCNFCLWPQVMYQGSHYRTRCVKDVADEMEHLVKEKGFRSVYFDDDTFNIGKERMLEFCAELKGRGLDRIPWAIMARPDLMDEDVLRNMKEAGLWAVKYGVESAAKKLTSRAGKSMDLKKAEAMIRLTNNLGIRTHLTFTFGLPGETKATLESTIRLAKRLDPFSVQFSIATPFPGTVFFNELDRENRILTKDWSSYDGQHSCVFQPANLSPGELEEAKRRAYGEWERHCAKRLAKRGRIKAFLGSMKDHGLRKTIGKTAGYLARTRPAAYLTGYRRNSYLGLLRRYLDAHGAKAAALKVKEELSLSNLKDKYLRALGAYDGEYAYLGPHHVQIDLTNRCNNSCLACWCNSPLFKTPRMSEKEKNEHLPLGMVKGLIDELAAMGTKEIGYSGSGEPFMHPDIMEILEYTKKKGLFCLVNTNFTLLDRPKLKRIADMGLDSITISLWAATAGTYKRTHPGRTEEDFSRLMENLAYLNEIKKGKPRVHLYNVVFSMNYFEIEGMVDLAVRTSSEMLGFALVDTIPGVTDQLLLNKKQLEELKHACLRIRSRLNAASHLVPEGIFLHRFDDFFRRLSVFNDAAVAKYDRNIIDSMPCYNGWLFARVIPNGQVHSCLKAHRIPVGSLYKNKFSEIWNSHAQMYFRKKTKVYQKSDHFFRSIGNDPGICEAGCYKGCDDIGRNAWMRDRMAMLTFPEKCVLRSIAGTLRMSRGKKI